MDRSPTPPMLTAQRHSVLWIGVIAGLLAGCGATPTPPLLFYAKGVPWALPKARLVDHRLRPSLTSMGAIWLNERGSKPSPVIKQWIWPPRVTLLNGSWLVQWSPSISPNTVSVYVFLPSAIDKAGLPQHDPIAECTVNKTYPINSGCDLHRRGRLMITHLVPTRRHKTSYDIIISAMWLPYSPTRFMMHHLMDHQARWMIPIALNASSP